MFLPKRRSKVWDSFRIEGQKAVCRTCDTVIRHSGSTSNLINHMRAHTMNINTKPENENIENAVDGLENVEEIVVYEEDEHETKSEVLDSLSLPPTTEHLEDDPTVETVIIDSACRICLCDAKSQSFVQIDKTIMHFDNISYQEIFTQLCGFDVLTGEPQLLCASCAKKLIDVHELKQKCVETQGLLDFWTKNDEHVVQETGEVAIDAHSLLNETEDQTGIDYIIEEVEEEQLFETPVNVKYEEDEIFEEKPLRSKFRRSSKEYTCTECNASFQTRRSFRDHLRIKHYQERDHECPHCKVKQFAFFLNDHIQQCRKAHARRVCPICGIDVDYRNFTRHIESHKYKSADHKPFTCDICDARIISKCGLVKHMRIQHLHHKLQCEVCLKEFKTPSVKMTHIRKYHPERKPPLKCKMCDFTAADPSVMRRHHLYHTGEKPHKCEVCGKEFRAKDALRDHLTTHSDERPFPCVTCSSRFKTRKALGVHMKTHRAHEYECPKCKKTYLTNQQMRVHVKRAHPEYELPPPGTIFNKNWRLNKAREEIKEMAVREGFDPSVVESMIIDEPPTIETKIYIRQNYTDVGLID